jgi:hypothetical protein
VAPDGARFGFVLLDASGASDNKITVVDTAAGGGTRTFTLRAPTLDAGTTDTILYADAMDFTADGRFLIYDALNELHVRGGEVLQVWSIFALDLETEITRALAPPVRGFDISNPALSQTSDNFIVFDAFDEESAQSTVYAMNLTTGDRKVVATVNEGFGVPGYSGDDSAIVYSQLDSATPTEFSLVRQPIKADHISPSGAPSALLKNADFGVIYRRGDFVGPGGCTGDCKGDGVVTVDELLTMVNIALGNAPVSDCTLGDASGDGQITVDEILTAVDAALNGCGGA